MNEKLPPGVDSVSLGLPPRIELKHMILQHTGNKAKPVKPRAIQIGRNEPCPCGSGKKFKKCHYRMMRK